MATVTSLRPLACTTFVAASVVLAIGMMLAAARFPDGFDWPYTVISALASAKHNPDGGAWFSGALALSLALLWPGALHVRREVAALGATPGWGHVALRIGLAGGVLVGLERLLIFHLSSYLPKAHEALALVTFLALYAGLLALFRERIRLQPSARWAAFAVIAPLVAIGVSQGLLYVGQRDLGWVDRRWRDLGVPITLSFAFWQWLAGAMLWTGLGYLVWVSPERTPAATAQHP